MKKRRTSIYLPEDLDDFLKNEEKQTDFIEFALRLASRIDIESIKNLAHKHRVHPDLLVDAAVLYFSKLDLPEQADKLIDYLEIMRQQALEREKQNT